MPTARKHYIQSLFHNANTNILHGTVESTDNDRHRYWQAWCSFLHSNFPQVRPYLQDISHQEAIELLVAFARHVRSGCCNPASKQVRAQTVSVALSAIWTQSLLDGQPAPLGRTKGQAWPYKISRQIESYRREDPPTSTKLAIPISVIQHLAHK